MEATIGHEAAHRALSEELDRLGEKVDRAVLLIESLKNGRLQMQDQCDSLSRELDRVLAAAQASNTTGVLQALDRLRDLEEENRALLRERAEVCDRVSGLIEKVDLLEQGS